MGITANCAKFLFYGKSLGVNYQRTLTLGRLNLFATRNDIRENIQQFKNNAKSLEEVKFRDEYSEPLLEILGAVQTDSMDYSDYEKPTLVQDLNEPVPGSLKSKFTAIVDGGTIEHVFNFPMAIRNCMEMLEVGGHYVGITPVNNLVGHGFYQFSPELYYRVFSQDNGFETVRVVICAQTGEASFSDWYEVVDPKTAKERVVFSNSVPAYLMIIARKVAEVPVFSKTPQQSDYQATWAISQSIADNKPLAGESKLRFLYRKMVPRPLRAFSYNLRNMFKSPKQVEAGLGEINPSFYKKIDLPTN